MRQNFGVKPWLYPMPVLMIGTYNADGSANIMNAAWGGVTEEAQLTICVEAEHATAKNIQNRKALMMMFLCFCLTAWKIRSAVRMKLSG